MLACPFQGFSMSDFDYDLFVIGAGSGGVRASRIAASHGARVAVAEEYRVGGRSEEHTSELQSLMRISYAVFCLKTKTQTSTRRNNNNTRDKTKTDYSSKAKTKR